MKGAKNHLTPPYFRYTARLIRLFPDFDFSFIKPVRQKAIQGCCVRIQVFEQCFGKNLEPLVANGAPVVNLPDHSAPGISTVANPGKTS